MLVAPVFDESFSAFQGPSSASNAPAHGMDMGRERPQAPRLAAQCRKAYGRLYFVPYKKNRQFGFACKLSFICSSIDDDDDAGLEKNFRAFAESA